MKIESKYNLTFIDAVGVMKSEGVTCQVDSGDVIPHEYRVRGGGIFARPHIPWAWLAVRDVSGIVDKKFRIKPDPSSGLIADDENTDVKKEGVKPMVEYNLSPLEACAAMESGDVVTSRGARNNGVYRMKNKIVQEYDRAKKEWTKPNGLLPLLGGAFKIVPDSAAPDVVDYELDAFEMLNALREGCVCESEAGKYFKLRGCRLMMRPRSASDWVYSSSPLNSLSEKKYRIAPKEFRPFWLVWCEATGGPTKKHYSEDGAKAEALRLSKKHKVLDFHILEYKTTIQSES